MMLLRRSCTTSNVELYKSPANMAEEKRKLSIGEKADYIPAFLAIGGSAIAAPFTGPFRGSEGADTYKHHIAHAIVRKFNSRLSSIQSQYLQPSFQKAYEKWCHSHGVLPEIVTTSAGVRGFWMGDAKKAKYVVIYYHGGGFAIHGTDGHIHFWNSVQKYLSQAGISTAFFFVLYTLTPHAVYPTQLRESVDAVRYVLQECRRSPREILLSGDSAGGNLATSVLLHLSHPAPDVEPLQLKEKLKGLVLMAPWVSLDVTWPSFKRNRRKDYLEADTEGRWAAEYLVSRPHDMYTDPAIAPAESWKDAMAEDVFVTMGSSEALYDGIDHWVQQYRSVNPNIKMEVGQDEVHIAPIVWPMFGDSHETHQAKAIKEYMKQHLTEPAIVELSADRSDSEPAVLADEVRSADPGTS